MVRKVKLVEFTRSCNGFTRMIRIADIGVSLTSLTTLVTKVPLIIYAFLSLDADNLLSWQPITLCWYPAPQELWNDYYRLFPFLCRWMIRQRFLICTCSCSQNFSRYGQLCGNPRTVIWIYTKKVKLTTFNKVSELY